MKEQIFELESNNKLEEITIAIKEIRAKVEKVLDSSESQKNIKIDQLKEIEKEQYKLLIKKLAYTKDIEEIKKLAIVLKDVGDLTRDIGDLTDIKTLNDKLKYYTDAAVCYQYALTINPEQTEKLSQELQSIKEKILLSIRPESNEYSNINDETIENKKILSDIRSNASKAMKMIETYYAKRKEASENEDLYISSTSVLFKEITQKMQEFLARLYASSEKEIETPPCKYTVIGLGSMALNQMTPYSDLEFAILIEDKNYTKEDYLKVQEYFKNLTHLVNFKIINLGETTIAFSKYNINLDHLVKVAVNLDLGGKTPLSRTDKYYELIQTVNGMLKYVHNKDDKTSHVDKHLTHILEKACYIYGDKRLIDEYKAGITQFLKEKDSEYQLNYQTRALNVLKEGCVEIDYQAAFSKEVKIKGNLEQFKPNLIEGEGRLFDVKKEIYRMPDRLIYNLGLYYGIEGNSAWDTVDQLHIHGIIGDEAATHLKYAVTFATTIRLKTYLYHGSQKEDMSIFPHNEEKLKEQQTKIFHLFEEDIGETGGLFQYFYTTLPLHKKLKEFCEQNNTLSSEEKKNFFKENKFYNDTPANKGLIHYRLAQYDKTQEQLEEALHNPENIDDLILLKNTLGIIYANFGKGKEAIEQFQYCLEVYKKTHGNIDHVDIADSLNGLGSAYKAIGQYEKAIKYYTESLEMRKLIYKNESHPDIADSLNNIGSVYYAIAQYDKTIEYYTQSLEIRQIIYKGEPHPNVAKSLSNLGLVYRTIGNHNKAIEYITQSLEMQKFIYKNEPHLDIAKSSNYLGIVYYVISQYDKAIEYITQSLEMQKFIYKNEPHPDIAHSLNNIGIVYRSMGQYEKAIKYYTESLEMRKLIYKNEPHSDIAGSLNNLGVVYDITGDYEKAIKYHTQSLEMRKLIYKNEPHSDIASSLSNLGIVYDVIGQYEKAIKYHTQSLEMKKIIYKDEQNPHIVLSLINLGKVYYAIDQYEQAIKYYTQSLEMSKFIYKNEPHSNIVKSLNGLGSVYMAIGDYKKAVEYLTQSLEISKFIYKNGQHPDIADSFDNLGEVYRIIGQYDKAIECHEKSLETSKFVYQGKPHLNIAASLSNLANSYYEKADYENAMNYNYKARTMIYQFSNDFCYKKIQAIQTISDKIIVGFTQRYHLDELKIKKEFDDLLKQNINSEDFKKHYKILQSYCNIKKLDEIIEEKFDKESVLTNSFKCQITNFEEIPVKDQSDLRIVSYNITSDYFDQNDKTEDKYHHWQYRAKFVKQLLITLNPDIMCLQEVSLNQAQELVKTFNVYKYKARFLSQHPSEIPAGEIVDEHGIDKWENKFTATPLLGIFVGNSWNISDVGKFWLNDKPFEEPQYTDRGITDKGFGNMNTYRAVMWIKLEHKLNNKSLFVFNSHYPLSGDNKTRYSCAELEMKQIQKISESNAWISCGDRNIIPTQRDDKTYNPETVYKALTKFGFDVRDAQKHYGISTSFLGFSYDKYCNSVKSGDFTDSSQIDMIISNTRAKHSFTCHGGFDPKTNELLSLSSTTIPDWQDITRSFASDHALIGGDFSLELLGTYNN